LIRLSSGHRLLRPPSEEVARHSRDFLTETQAPNCLLRWMPAQLGPETREAILLVKSAWASRPEYGKSIASFDIYTAVLKRGVRTREDFEEWVANRHRTP
jgi:hypothetical protein